MISHANRLTTAVLLCLPAVVTPFSSIAAPYPDKNAQDGMPSLAPSNNNLDVAATPISASWRVVLDIGREPLSTMPFAWARSGGRMPLKIPCDFVQTEKGETYVQPQSDTVSMTGPSGAVTRPIVGGSFVTKSNDQELEFALTFPETLMRNDVSIPAGTTIQCTGRIYTQSEFDRLYQAFYNARDKAWELGGQLNAMTKVEGPPKKWNEELQRWENRNKSVNPLEWAKTRLAYAQAKALQNRHNEERPDPKDLSDRGFLPGVEGKVYVAKEGLARTQTGAVIGRWSMEPVLEQPVSYR
jgi:hypothetical protein